MKKFFLSTILFFSLFLTGCCVTGSEKTVNQSRVIKQFDNIVVDIDANIFLQEAENHKVQITAEENIISLVNSKIKNDTLILNLKKSCVKNTKPIDIIISFPKINQIVLNKGQIKTNKRILSSDLDLEINTTGKVDLELATEKLSAKINENSEVWLTGWSNESKLDINADVNLQAYNLFTQKTDITFDGKGDAKIFVTENLNANLNGDVNIFFKGEPKKINENISGSGNLKNMEDSNFDDSFVLDFCKNVATLKKEEDSDKNICVLSKTIECDPWLFFRAKCQ